MTQLTIEGDDVWLKRRGELNAELMFTKKHLYEAAYKTPDGLMQMSVLPTMINSDVSAEKGCIKPRIRDTGGQPERPQQA
jgi:uncharacterized beta-barrel protein YwiB (DUF1934 family)